LADQATKPDLTGQAGGDNPRTPGMLSVAVPLRMMRAAPTGDDLDALARKHAMDPDVFAENPPFFLTANISNNLLDAYRTKMHRSSLENYAADAETGVAVLQSHNSRELPLGRSIAGRFVGAGGNAVQRVEADAYLMTGMQLGSVPVDQVVRGIRGGVVKDVSIGFYGGTYRCSICGLSYWSWDCTHIAGVEYQAIDENGDPSGDPETAFVWIHDAHLAEFSLVYDGATPQAEIVAIKAQQESDAGRLRPETARLLEARYRIHLPGAAHRWPGAEPTKEQRDVTEKAKTETAGEPARTVVGVLGDTTLERAMELLEDAGVPEAERGSIEAAVRWMGAELERLRPLADTGRAYRVDLIEEALAEGVRAFGDRFPREAEKASLERSSLDEIKAKRDFYAAEARKRYPGGRQTEEPETPRDPAPPAGERLPDAAYAAR
jgi:hypothetical protein